MPVAAGVAFVALLVGRMFDAGRQVVVVSPHPVFVEARVMNECGQFTGELPLATEGGLVTASPEQVGVREMVADLPLR